MLAPPLPAPFKQIAPLIVIVAIVQVQRIASQGKLIPIPGFVGFVPTKLTPRMVYVKLLKI